MNKYKDKTTDSISTTFIFDSLIEAQKEKNKKNLEIVNLFSFDPAMRIKVLASTIKEHKDPREFNKYNYDSVSKLYLYLNEQLKFDNIDVDIAMDKEFGFCFHPMADTVLNNIDDFDLDLGELLRLDDMVSENMELFNGNIAIVGALIINTFSSRLNNIEKYLEIIKSRNLNEYIKLSQERWLALIGALDELGKNGNSEALTYLGYLYDPFLEEQTINGRTKIYHKDYLTVKTSECEVKLCCKNIEKAIKYYIQAALAGHKAAINRICELRNTKKCNISDNIYEDVRIVGTKKTNMVKMLLENIDIERCENYLIDFEYAFDKK